MTASNFMELFLLPSDQNFFRVTLGGFGATTSTRPPSLSSTERIGFLKSFATERPSIPKDTSPVPAKPARLKLAVCDQGYRLARSPSDSEA